MSELTTPMPVPSAKRFNGAAVMDGPRSGSDDNGGYAAKIKIRFLIEKELAGEWVPMARLSAESDRMRELCEALGGKIRVLDLVTQSYVVEEEFE